MQSQDETSFINVPVPSEQPQKSGSRNVILGALALALIVTAAIATTALKSKESASAMASYSSSEEESAFRVASGKSKGKGGGKSKGTKQYRTCQLTYNSGNGASQTIGGDLSQPGGYMETFQVQFDQAGTGKVPYNSFAAFLDVGFRGYCAAGTTCPITWQETTTYNFGSLGSFQYQSPFTTTGASSFYEPGQMYSWLSDPRAGTGYFAGKEVSVHLSVSSDSFV